jgi:hypothetical protein
MPSTQPAEVGQPAVYRPWYRLHASTWAAVCFCAICYLVVTVPGHNLPEISDDVLIAFDTRAPYTMFNSLVPEDFYLHGWPYPFLKRFYINRTNPSIMPTKGSPPWMRIGGWYGGQPLVFSPPALLLDLGVFVTALVVIAAYFERRGRTGLRIWQFTLREMFVLTLLVAACLCYWQSHHKRRQLEFAACEKLGANTYAWNCQAPVFLQRVFGTSLLKDFDGIETIYLLNNDHVTPEQCAECLENSPYLTFFEYTNDTPPGKELFNPDVIHALGACRNLKILHVSDTGNGDLICQSVSPFARLKYVTLCNAPITAVGAKALGGMQSLTDLRLQSTSIDCSILDALLCSKTLRSLDISGVNMDPAAVEKLSHFVNLESLYLPRIGINAESIGNLQEKLPHCKVNFDATK